MSSNDRSFSVQSVNADHKDIIHDVAYNFYGNRMATCSSDQQVKVWDKIDGQWVCTAQWKAHNGSVWKVTWGHPEFGQILATCSFDRTASVWEEIRTDAESSSHWVKRNNIVDSRTDVTDIKFSPRHLGLQLAASSTDGYVRVYDAPDIMNLAQWSLSSEINCKMSVSCLSWSPSYGRTAMIAVGCDATASGNLSRAFIYEWNDAARSWIRILNLPVDTPVHDLAFAAQAGRSFHLLAVAAADLRVFALRPSAGRSLDSGSASSATSQSNGVGGGGSGSGESAPKFDIRLVLESQEHAPSAWRVSWNCSGSILSSAGDDGTVRLWKSQPSGKWACILTLKGDGSKIRTEPGLAPSASEPALRAGADGVGSALVGAGASAGGVAARFYKMGGVSHREHVVWH